MAVAVAVAAARWAPALALLLSYLLLLQLAAAASARMTEVTPMPVNSPPSTSSAASTTAFQLQGNVYPIGEFYTTMNIGNPVKPYFMHIDTGSDLSWLQCDAPCRHCDKVPHPLYRPKKHNIVPCASPLCGAVHNGQGTHPSDCTSPHDLCGYEINYKEGSYSRGMLIADKFSLRLKNSSIVHPSLGFGCGYDQHLGNKGESPTDGVLALGRAEIGLVSQLKQQGVTKNVISHCLRSEGGGFLFLGDGVIPPKSVTWVPMVRITSGNHYSPGFGTLYLDRQPLGLRPVDVIFDSGTTYTYFASHQYQVTVLAIKSSLRNSLIEDEEPGFELCWKGTKPFKSVQDVKKYFKPLGLQFGNKAIFEIPPENYLIVTKNGNACLGILDGSAQPYNLIGDITLLDQMVIYDNERGWLGWVRGKCSTKADSSVLFSFP